MGAAIDTQTTIDDPPRVLLRKTLVHAFVLFNLFAIGAWAFTSDQSGLPFHEALRTRLSSYMTFTGLRQTWTMFAPNPIRSNVYVEAEVTFSDGSRATWAVPRMAQLGQFRRHQKERFRKWSMERLASDPPNPALARAAARYAARQVNAPPGALPRRVELVRYSSPIPAPVSRRLPRQQASSARWDRITLFVCELDDAGEVTRVIETGSGAATRPAVVPSEGGVTAEPATGEAR